MGVIVGCVFGVCLVYVGCMDVEWKRATLSLEIRSCAFFLPHFSSLILSFRKCGWVWALGVQYVGCRGVEWKRANLSPKIRSRVWSSFLFCLLVELGGCRLWVCWVYFRCGFIMLPFL